MLLTLELEHDELQYLICYFILYAALLIHYVRRHPNKPIFIERTVSDTAILRLFRCDLSRAAIEVIPINKSLRVNILWLYHRQSSALCKPIRS